MVMAATGMILIMFVFVHLLGNSSVYAGPNGINEYAVKLHGLGPFVWAFRLFMLAVFALHLFFGIQVSLENRAAKPQGYAVTNYLKANLASKTMIYTGLLLLGFIIYHLLHFTLHITNPDISSSVNVDAAGRPDVFRMVLFSFQNMLISLVYLAAMITLFFHLSHGIQSLFQTLGLNDDRTLPAIGKIGKGAAVVLFLGYTSIPLVILLGLLKG